MCGEVNVNSVWASGLARVGVEAEAFNGECWFGIDKSATNTLENIQYSFLRSILGIGTGCPLPLLLSETGMILMELRVLKKKLIFLHHLTHLGEDTLAHEILSVQNNLDLPGLVSECKDFLNHHQISDLSENCLVSSKFRCLAIS